MPRYVSFDENGVLREREMTCEERVAELTKANMIHIDDVYEAIGLLTRWRSNAAVSQENANQLGLGGVYTDTSIFLTRMSGPQR